MFFSSDTEITVALTRSRTKTLRIPTGMSACDVCYSTEISFLLKNSIFSNWELNFWTAARRKADLFCICATSLVILFEEDTGHCCSCVTSSLKINWRRTRGWSKKPKADSRVLWLQTFVLGWCQEHLDPVAHIMQYPLGRCASTPAFFVSIFSLQLTKLRRVYQQLLSLMFSHCALLSVLIGPLHLKKKMCLYTSVHT